MILFTYTIHRQGRTDFTKDFAALDQVDADQQLAIWVEKMHFEESITTSFITEPLADQIAFHLTEEAEFDAEGDPVTGAWQKWKLLDMQHLRSLFVEETEEGKKVEFYRSNYENTDKFLQSLSSHRYPDRANEVSIDQYDNAIEEWTGWLYNQVNLSLAKAFNDSHHLGANKAWWKLITPEALIILITNSDGKTHTITVYPHSPEDEDYGYQFQLDRVKPEDEISLDEFGKQLEEYLGFFRFSNQPVAH